MARCGRCGADFTPGDAVDLAAINLPVPFRSLRPLLKEQLTRLFVFRCSAPECGGLVTALYLPRTPSLEK